MGARRTTAADVAGAAGVSRSTVSYILNGSQKHTFPPETVDRVRAAAHRLAYTPHAAARALRRGQSGVVLLAVQEMPPSLNLSRLFDALTSGVRATGRSLVMWSRGPDNRLVDVLLDVSPEAVLEVFPLPPEDAVAAGSAGIPVVSLAPALRQLEEAAGAAQVEHLLARGHRRLAVVTVDDAELQGFAAPRLRGAVRAAQALRLPPPEVVAVSRRLGQPWDPAVEQLAAALRGWRTRPEPVTGVCCFNDTFAALTVAAARAAGLQVPSDVAVVGIDDDYVGELSRPTLTTVRYDFAGTREHLRARLEALPREGRPAVVPVAAPAGCAADHVQVVQRESTAPPRRGLRDGGRVDGDDGGHGVAPGS